MMRLLWMFWMVFACSLAHGVELLGEPQLQIQDEGATLRWKTDVACGTRVNYGLSAEKLDQKIEGPVMDAHEVTLKGLKAGTTYHYGLGSARQRLHEGQFTMPGKGNAVAVEPVKAPERQSIFNKVLDILSPDAKPVAKTPATVAQPRAPPTREIWGRMDTLQDHFDRHGADFQSRSPDDYAAQCWQFLQRGRTGQVLMKWDDADGTLRLFDPKTRAFAAYNRDGRAKTYFRPNNPAYWQRQPGRLIQPANLPF